jgi:carbamoylphosphate synthase large subunit
MKIFEYDGINSSNNSCSGTIEASDGAEAILKLYQRGIYPKSVVELSSSQIRAINKIENLKKFRNKLNKQTEPQPQLHEQVQVESMSKRVDLVYIGFVLIIIVLTVCWLAR